MRPIPDNLPFKPGKWPFFYGYWIMGCTALGMIMTSPGQTIGVSPFTDILLANLELGKLNFALFGWVFRLNERLLLSTAYMIGTILSSLMIVRIGKMIDRYGSRIITSAACLVFGTVLVLMSRVDRIAYSISRLTGDALLPVVSMVCVTLGFMLMRFLGQGVLSLASRIMIMRWFVVRRGRMNAVVSVFVSIVFSASPKFLKMLIERFTWRGAWMISGLIIGIGFFLFSLAFYRDSPESCGLIADGGSRDKERETTGEKEINWTLAEAKRTYSFWVFNIGLALYGFFSTAVMFHIESIFGLSGIGSVKAFSIFIPAAVISVSVSLAAGYISDKHRIKYLLTALMGSFTLYGLGVLLLSGGYGYYMIIAGTGISSGLMATLIAVTWPKYFGREHLGAISGYNMFFLVLFSALGPFVFGLSQTLTGSYHPAVYSIMCVVVLFLVLSLRAEKPLKKV